MPIDNPTALVEEFKKSGEFDRLRREVLAQFQQDGSYTALKARVEEIGRQRLSTDHSLQYLTPELIQKELAQEVERYPIVERAVADVRVFSDPTFLESMQGSIQRILQEDRKKSGTSADTGGEVKPTTVTLERKAQTSSKVARDGFASNDTAPVDIQPSQTPAEDVKMEIGDPDTPNVLPEQILKSTEAASNAPAGQGTPAKANDPVDMDVDSPTN